MDNVRRIERIRRKGKNENKSERKINLKKIEIKEGNRKENAIMNILPSFRITQLGEAVLSNVFLKRF
jgi:hypothetical protein